MCECGAIREDRPAEELDGKGALCAGGAVATADVEACMLLTRICFVNGDRNERRIKRSVALQWTHGSRPTGVLSFLQTSIFAR